MNIGTEVLAWAVRTFGQVAVNRDERAARFVEEAIELAQAEGLSEDTVGKITRRVFSRPPGATRTEIGQAQLTLLALSENLNVDPWAEADSEFERIKKIPQDEWDRRHATKAKLGIANLTT